MNKADARLKLMYAVDDAVYEAQAAYNIVARTTPNTLTQDDAERLSSRIAKLQEFVGEAREALDEWVGGGE